MLQGHDLSLLLELVEVRIARVLSGDRGDFTEALLAREVRDLLRRGTHEVLLGEQ